MTVLMNPLSPYTQELKSTYCLINPRLWRFSSLDHGQCDTVTVVTSQTDLGSPWCSLLRESLASLDYFHSPVKLSRNIVMMSPPDSAFPEIPCATFGNSLPPSASREIRLVSLVSSHQRESLCPVRAWSVTLLQKTHVSANTASHRARISCSTYPSRF